MFLRALATTLALQVHLALSLQGGRGGANLKDLISHTISASAHTRSLEPQDGLPALQPTGIQLDSLGNAVSFFQTSSNSSSNTTQVSAAQEHRRLMRSTKSSDNENTSTKAAPKASDSRQGWSNGDRSSPTLHEQSEQMDEHSLTKMNSEVEASTSQSQTSMETNEQILSLPSIASSTLLDESNLLIGKLLERDTQTRTAPTIATYSSSDCSLGSKVAEVVVFPGKADAAGCMPGTSSTPDPLAKAKDANGVPVVAAWPQNPTAIKFECEGLSGSIVMHKATGGASESCDEVLGRTVISESWAVKAKEGKCVPAVDQNSGATQYVQMHSFADASVLPQCFNRPSVASVLRSSSSSSALLVGILCAAGIMLGSLVFVFIILPRIQSSRRLDLLPAPVPEPIPVMEEPIPPEAVVVEASHPPQPPQSLLEVPSGRAATSTDPAPPPEEEHVPAQPRSKSFRNLKSYTDKSYSDKRKSSQKSANPGKYLPDPDQEGPEAQGGSTSETGNNYVPEESWL